MDTISSMATQGAKTVWGEGDERREPISGVRGDVAKGEPYDAGNMETPDQRKLEQDRADEPGSRANALGDGPKPLEAAAREHGGANGTPTATAAPAWNDSRGDGAGSNTAGSNGPDGSKSPKRTQTQHVKTTGFAADGGDFDASKPGAGREADRLMEEKEAHRADASSKNASSSSSGAKHGKDKPSLGERIKDKLHKH